MKQLGGIVLFLASLLANATDCTDLWWNPAESGWGVNVVQQSDILFMTFFVYGPDGQPSWLVAPATQYLGTDGHGAQTYSGPLYRTTGSWFGAGWNSSAATANSVGTATFTLTSANDATVSYSVSGTTVIRQVVRQTFRSNPYFDGSYNIMSVADVTNCPGYNGHYEGQAQVMMSSTQMMMQGGNTCTLSTPYTAMGRMGMAQVSANCVNGSMMSTGTMTLSEIDANAMGFMARYETEYMNGCHESGRMAGVRR